jgi:2-polyprenyl-3-methyl-5-hydroxy-6-metoxy-1,4-benzoquinol methylase
MSTGPMPPPRDSLALHGREYAQRFDRRHGRRRLTQLLPLMKLEPDFDLVDFGCGNGLLAAEVWNRVRSYTGVDFSEPFIELARAKAARLAADNVRFECSSIAEFCARNRGRFDVACALDFSEHVRDDDWLGILASVRQALKRGGSLYLHTPNAAFLLEWMKRRNLILTQSPEHVAVRTLEHNLRLLREAGYGIRAARYVPHYNVLRFLHPLRKLPCAGPWFEARIFVEASAP